MVLYSLFHQKYLGSADTRYHCYLEAQKKASSHYSPSFLLCQVTDFVSSEVWESFDNGEIVMFKDYGFLTACTIIPTLSEAHVIGR